VNPAREHRQFQLSVLGLVFAVLDVIFLAVLARCAAQIGAWLVRKPKTAVRGKVRNRDRVDRTGCLTGVCEGELRRSLTGVSWQAN
jgi:hypothetical protein